jgi:hypothetical protein
VTIWEYGMGSDAAEALAQPLRPLPHWTGKFYQASETFPDPEFKHARLISAGGHPGQDTEHCVVRRWTAPESGTVRVAGTLRHSRDKGDGVIAIVRHKETNQSFQTFNGTAKTVVPPMQVRRGDRIDLVVSPGKTTTADAYVWQVAIIGIGGKLKGETWKTQDDFGPPPPPPPPLKPLAQLAQALMLTNEFLYLD